MKKLLAIITIVLIFKCDTADELCTPNNTDSVNPHSIQVDTIPIVIPDPLSIYKYPAYQLDINPLIDAMILVESSGNDSAYCRSEEAVGCLQIRPIMLYECNRILKLKKSTKRYILLDRWSRTKSIEIFHIVNKHNNKTNSYEAIARSWNGGPRWAQKSGTERYWSKVKCKLQKLVEEDEYSYDWLAQL